jgi:hypothetical protein
MTDRLIYIVEDPDGAETIAVFDCKQLAEDFAKEYSKLHGYIPTVDEKVVNKDAGKKCLTTYVCYVNIDTGKICTRDGVTQLIGEDCIRFDADAREIVAISSVSKECAEKLAKKKWQYILEMQLRCEHSWSNRQFDWDLREPFVECVKCTKRILVEVDQ